jgi:hypothetical protein
MSEAKSGLKNYLTKKKPYVTKVAVHKRIRADLCIHKQSLII